MRLQRMRSFVLGLVLAVTACGDDGGDRPVDAGLTGDSSSDDGAVDDGAVSDALPCGTAGPAEMMCGAACVDTSSDPDHCGDCITMCSGTTPACAGGTCVMPLATTWEHHFGGAEFGYYGIGVAVDGAGNTYLSGMFLDTIDLGGGPLVSAGNTDIVVASFAPDGSHLWSQRLGGSGGDQGAGITVVGGTVYVTGSFSGSVNFGGAALTSAGQTDIFVVGLTTTGSHSFSKRFGTAASDAGLGIVADANGNISIGGFFGLGTIDFGGGPLTGAASDNAYVASLSSTGQHRWSRMLAGAASTFNSTQAIAVDAAGNVTTVGEFMGAADFGAGPVSSATANNFDVFVASFTAAGAPRWSRIYGAGQSDAGQAVATDASGNVVVGGSFHNTVDFGGTSLTSSGVIDGFVMILEGGTGATRFARKLGAATSGVVRAVRADSAGNAIATGTIEGAADFGTGALAPLGVYDVFLAGFDKTTGAGVFAKRYGGTDYDGTYGLAVSAGNGMALAGQFRGTVELGTGPIVGGARDNGFVMMVAR